MANSRYYAIGAKVTVNGVRIFRVLEIATNAKASLEAMSRYADLYVGVARRIATEAEFAAYSAGHEIEFGI